jgi:DNA-binding NarL/FixJ family response regulator
VDRIVSALSTSERERPDVRAATRLDWHVFATQLPHRLRRILCWLAIGASKTWIARKLNVTRGRVSQMLDTLGREITTFFGADVVPGAYLC